MQDQHSPLSPPLAAIILGAIALAPSLAVAVLRCFACFQQHVGALLSCVLHQSTIVREL